ncbi:MAG: competence/damage-inducible protein A [Holosporales bacterium]
MSSHTDPTAAVLLIGNEILSGQVQDKNLAHIALRLQDIGIMIGEARVVPDVEEMIIDALNTLRHRYTYVFTTGGIGPTHDDITARCVAKAFGQEFVRNARAAELLSTNLSPNTNLEGRLRMAMMPKSARLLECQTTKAPGFAVENVYVMAGIPHIMHEMLEAALPELTRGKKREAFHIYARIPESRIAHDLEAIQNHFPMLEIGSYPKWDQEGPKGIELVIKGHDKKITQQAAEKVIAMLASYGVEPQWGVKR